MTGHIGRKFNPDPLIGKNINLHESAWDAIDAVRGKQTSAEWIRVAIKTALYYDAIEKAKLAS